MSITVHDVVRSALCSPLRVLRAGRDKRKNFTRFLICIVALAFGIRIAARCYTGAAVFWESGYLFFFEIAKNITAGNGIGFDGDSPTCFRVPLYAIFLAAVTFGHKSFLSFLSVLFFQSLIGAGTALCAAFLAREMFGKTAALIAGFLTAIYPYYVMHDTALQETSLFTFLTILSALLLVRVHRTRSNLTSVWAGLALGALVLTRANLAPFAMFAPLWLALPERPRARRWRQRIRTALLCAGMIAVTISPWLIRSYRLTGSATLTTESGFFLWLGNNPMTFSFYPGESIDKSQEVAVESLTEQDKAEIAALGQNEAAVDQWYREKGIAYMREHPWRTFTGGLRKIEAAFGWLPSPRKSFWPNLMHAASYGPIMILGLWGMWSNRRRWRMHLLFYGLFVSFAAVTAVFFGHTNYRSYLDVYWIVFAAGALSHLFQKYESTRFGAGGLHGDQPVLGALQKFPENTSRIVR